MTSDDSDCDDDNDMDDGDSDGDSDGNADNLKVLDNAAKAKLNTHKPICEEIRSRSVEGDDLCIWKAAFPGRV